MVCTKLHLKSYTDTRTGVAGVQPAAWQLPDYRAKLVEDGHRWPTLGEQYQMREVLTEGLVRSGYREQPTMYFARGGLGPEKWKSIMVDQDKQEAEVAIGLGGSSSCRRSEAITDVNWKTLLRGRRGGPHPAGLGDPVLRGGAGGQGGQDGPVDAATSRRRAAPAALPRMLAVRRAVAGAGSVPLRNAASPSSTRAHGRSALTPQGEVLVEAIINSEF